MSRPPFVLRAPAHPRLAGLWFLYTRSRRSTALCSPAGLGRSAGLTHRDAWPHPPTHPPAHLSIHPSIQVHPSMPTHCPDWPGAHLLETWSELESDPPAPPSTTPPHTFKLEEGQPPALLKWKRINGGQKKRQKHKCGFPIARFSWRAGMEEKCSPSPRQFIESTPPPNNLLVWWIIHFPMRNPPCDLIQSRI